MKKHYINVTLTVVITMILFASIVIVDAINIHGWIDELSVDRGNQVSYSEYYGYNERYLPVSYFNLSRDVVKVYRELEWYVYVPGSISLYYPYRCLVSGRYFVIVFRLTNKFLGRSVVDVIDMERGEFLFRVTVNAWPSAAVYKNYLITVSPYCYPELVPKSCHVVCIDMNSSSIYRLEILWDWGTFEGECLADPVTYGDRVYIPLTNGVIYVFNVTNGDIIDKLNVSNPVYASPAILNDGVYVGDVLGNVYRISRTDGRACIVFKAKGSIVGRILSFDGKLLFFDNLGHIYCFDLRSNKILWLTRLDGKIYDIFQSVHSVVVNVGIGNSTFVKVLSMSNGKVIRTFKGECVQVIGRYAVLRDAIVDLKSTWSFTLPEVAKGGYHFQFVTYDKIFLLRLEYIIRKNFLGNIAKLVIYKIRNTLSVDAPSTIYIAPGETVNITLNVKYTGILYIDGISASVRVIAPLHLLHVILENDKLYLTIKADIWSLESITYVKVNVTFKNVDGSLINETIYIKVKVYEITPLLGYMLGVEVFLITTLAFNLTSDSRGLSKVSSVSNVKCI